MLWKCRLPVVIGALRVNTNLDQEYPQQNCICFSKNPLTPGGPYYLTSLTHPFSMIEESGFILLFVFNAIMVGLYQILHSEPSDLGVYQVTFTGLQALMGLAWSGKCSVEVSNIYIIYHFANGKATTMSQRFCINLHWKCKAI